MATVRGDGYLAVIAGSDTTATALTATWYYFLRNPEKLDRLKNEIDAYFPGEEPRNFTRLATMPYLNSCM
jgi:cytochrome P450